MATVPEGSGFSIGVDIGGTFTDLVVTDTGGRVRSAKAYTTPDDYSRGILDAIDVASGELGLSAEELLGRTKVFVNGTTIVTNALAELRGVKVGLLTTQGFRDTLRIARSARTNDLDLQTQLPPPELVARDAIAEVSERIDYAGRVVVPLDIDQAARQARLLVEDRGVEALAVCFLWSFRSPEHEQSVQRLLAEMYPDLFVTISSDLYPVAREYERMVTTVLNCYTSRGAADYLSGLEDRLRARGLRVPIGVIQSTGGIISVDEARRKPIHLLSSGPVGGVEASNRLGRLLGIGNIITADMGGTSFDTAVLVQNEISYLHRARVNRLDTGLSLVDLNTVGAGGGSICQLDDQGLPQAGPHSAGAVPGPACYDRGGQEPCITDVAAALNLIDPDYFLGGAVKLAPELARKALQGRIAGPLGISAEDAAAGLYDLIVSNMSDAVRAISVERGHDPREFKLVSYGGAASLYIAAIAADLGISQVIIPNRASVFSAQGLLMSDYRRNAVQTVNWNLAKGDISELNGTFNALSAQVREELERSGFQAGDVTLAWDGDFKFGTQVYELTIPIPVGELKETDKPGMAQRFITEYERLYGEGASWENAENLIMLLNVRVTGTAATVKPGFVEYPVVTDGAERASAGERMVYIPSKREKREIPVYRDERFEPGMTVSGNCVIESKDTTIYVPADVTANMDTYRNYVLSL